MVTVIVTGEVIGVREAVTAKGTFVDIKIASDGNTVYVTVPPELKAQQQGFRESDIITVVGTQRTQSYEKDGVQRRMVKVMASHLRIDWMARSKEDKDLPTHVQEWVNDFNSELDKMAATARRPSVGA